MERLLNAAFANDGEPVASAAMDEFAALALDVDQYVLLEGDFDGDGLTDLLFVHLDADGTTLILDLRLANADGTWTFHRHEIQGVEGIDLELLLVDEIDGDGRDDLIFSMRDLQNGVEQRLYVVRSLGDGQWADVQPVSEDDYVLETVCSASAWDTAIEELAFAQDATVGANGLVAFVPVYVEGGNDSDDSAARLVLDFRPALRSGVTELQWIAEDASGEPTDALPTGHETGETGYELASAQSRPGGQDPRSQPPRERYTVVVERVAGGKRAR